MAVKAALCLAALWQWREWLGVVMLGFAAMLHPSEMLALKRSDFFFPKTWVMKLQECSFTLPTLRLRDSRDASMGALMTVTLFGLLNVCLVSSL